MASRYNNIWYLNRGDGSTTGYFGIAQRAPLTQYYAGKVVRSKDANSRIYLCVLGGVSSSSADAGWSTSIYSETLDGNIRWMELGGGRAPLNGDIGNTMSWAQAKAFDPTAQAGAIIKSATALYVTRNGGVMGTTEPDWTLMTGGLDVPGTLVGDGTITWTNIGPFANFPPGSAPYEQLYQLHEFWATGQNELIYIAHTNVDRPSNAYVGGNIDRAFTRMISHKVDGNYPPTPADLIQGATIIGLITVGWRGSSWIEGVNFINDSFGGISVSTGSTSARNWMYLKNCSIQMVNTSTAAAIRFGYGNQPTLHNKIILENTQFFFANAGCYIECLNADVTFQKYTRPFLMPLSIPTTDLWKSSYDINTPSTVNFDGIDLSPHTNNIHNAGGGNGTMQGALQFKDCRLNAFSTLTRRSTFASTGIVVQSVRSSESAYWHLSQRETYEGSDVTENLITRIGGTADPTGVRYSRKITTSANSSWWRHFRAEPYGTWNIRKGSVIVMIHGTINALTLPKNDEIWMEVSYLKTAGIPLGFVTHTTKLNILSAGVLCEEDTLASWAGGADTLPMAWEPSTPTGVALTNNNLTATNSGTTATDQGTKGGLTQGQTTGKFYFECKLDTLAGGANVTIGVGSTTATYTNMGNSGTSGAMVRFGTGVIHANGSNTGVNIGARVAGDVIAVAADLTNRKIWFRKVNGTPGNWNNNVSADPETNVGGYNLPATLPMIPFATFGGTGGLAGNKITLNCGQNVFTLLSRPPSFANWMSIWKHFKMRATINPQMPGFIHVRVRAAKPSTTYYIDPKIEISR